MKTQKEHWRKTTNIAQKITKQAVDIYSNLKTHYNLDLKKSADVHLNPNIKYKSYWKNKVSLPKKNDLKTNSKSKIIFAF